MFGRCKSARSHPLYVRAVFKDTQKFIIKKFNFLQFFVSSGVGNNLDGRMNLDRLDEMCSGRVDRAGENDSSDHTDDPLRSFGFESLCACVWHFEYSAMIDGNRQFGFDEKSVKGLPKNCFSIQLSAFHEDEVKCE